MIPRAPVDRASLVLVLALAIGAGAARHAEAHDLKPGVLTLAETADGEILVRLVPPIDSRGEAVELGIDLPPGCARAGERVHCERGLTGELTVTGMRGDRMKTVVVVTRQGGATEEWIVTAASPQLTIGPAPPRTWLPWIRIGVEHILEGPDHLAFVLGLLLVLEISLGRRLLLTLTAFTLAHSLTLALAALGLIAVPTAPVEACIAASVLLVAREATHREPTAIRRWPWLAAGGFGLIHGLGFAAALSEIGLPRASLASSLVWFNVGVELGQLVVVAAVVLLVWVARRLVGERRIVRAHVHRAACYALGALAAWWLVERIVDLACGGG